jgi:sugar phosphate isomerase/epimerase
MKFGVCGGLERFAAIAAAGAEYLEPSVATDAAPEGPRSDWAGKLAQIHDAGLTAEAWNCWVPGDLKVVGPQADWERYRRYAGVAISRVAEAGARVVVFGSGGARAIPNGYDNARAVDDFAKAVRIAADAAANAGIVIAIESLESSETNLLNTLAGTARFVEGIALPNVKCTADFYHMSAEGEPNELLVSIGRHVGHAHLADSGRGAPGAGTADIAGFLAGLRASGYEGRVSIECNWSDFNKQVGPALRFVRGTWAHVCAGA